GRRPFVADDTKELERRILSDDPPRPRRLCALDRDLETIILTCLAKEPARRYASAGALADGLRNGLDGNGVAGRPEGRLRRAWRGVRRHPTLMTGVAVALVCLAVAAPALWLTRKPPSPDEQLQALLESGKPFALVGDTGMPLRHVSRAGEVS